MLETVQTTDGSVLLHDICRSLGVDETVVVTLKFSKNRMATFTYSSRVELPNDAIIAGTKGTIHVGLKRVSSKSTQR